MRIILCCAAVSASLMSVVSLANETAPAAAMAAAPALKAGATLTTADGKRLGRIERVVTSADGAAAAASVIFDSRFVYVPASTISASEKGLVTTLSRAEVRKLK